MNWRSLLDRLRPAKQPSASPPAPDPTSDPGRFRDAAADEGELRRDHLNEAIEKSDAERDAKRGDDPDRFVR